MPFYWKNGMNILLFMVLRFYIQSNNKLRTDGDDLPLLYLSLANKLRKKARDIRAADNKIPRLSKRGKKVKELSGQRFQ
ncbi:hypothetical protein KIF59_14770 [Enterobacter cloacae subsp. cloacae]|nr:hypothetical protein [Enterobacter cloacae subsp. cloacae]